MLVVRRASSGELNCGIIVFPVCGPDDELFKASSRPDVATMFSDGLNFNHIDLAEESKTLLLASSDELNSGDREGGIRLVNGELLTESTRLSVPSLCSAELNRQEGDDCTRSSELIREYRWRFVGFTSCAELDCENGDNSMCCIDEELDKQSIGFKLT